MLKYVVMLKICHKDVCGYLKAKRDNKIGMWEILSFGTEIISIKSNIILEFASSLKGHPHLIGLIKRRRKVSWNFALDLTVF